MVFSSQGSGLDSIFDEIVINLYSPVIQEPCELIPTSQGTGHRAIPRTGYDRGTGFKKGLDLLNDRRRFGQGNRHLSSVFAHLMVLAFLIDQIKLRCSGFFRDAIVRTKQINYFREKTRNMSREFIIDSWEVLYSVIVGGYKIRLRIDSS